MTKPDRRPLYARRTRLRERADREAAKGQVWTKHFGPELRQRISFAFADEISAPNLDRVAGLAVRLIKRDEAWSTLPGAPTSDIDWVLEGRPRTPSAELDLFLKRCPDAYVPTAIEAMYQALGLTFNVENITTFVESVNEALSEDRVAFELVNGLMVEIESKELHSEVVGPALTLLGIDKRFANAERAYQEALAEVARGYPGDAITDAGTALQETLDSLGCEGDSLGSKITAARKKGILERHDVKLAKAIELALEWASANRSVRGESHHVTDADRDDAWLMVHIVGALILRLGRGTGA